MPKKLEHELHLEAERKGLRGKKENNYVYSTLNKIGAMHGNKVVKGFGKKK